MFHSGDIVRHISDPSRTYYLAWVNHDTNRAKAHRVVVSDSGWTWTENHRFGIINLEHFTPVVGVKFGR